jgi:cellulose synthase/poly-beta-1,6-N-acetylglucosamine synthase-like glycosyltransferase
VTAVALPFDGIPTVWRVLFIVAFVVIVMMLAWTTLLFVKAERAREHAPEAPEDGADAFTWLFLVPALNEAFTIRDSVARLLAMPVAHRHIVVIDDGSDDGTSEALAGIDAPDLHVLRREPPEARQGKAAALNYAYRATRELLAGLDRGRVIVVVVDADGRLRPDAPRFVAAHFAEDEQLGGVQSLVRIYNRQRALTWLQDVEFSVYGFLYQAGRTPWGTAGMGGNGQFNRLSALDAVADHEGPWRDRLTEDQDLGLRLLGAGWHGRQELRAAVDQQGLPGLRRLLRQRTRWSQGNLQAMGLLGVVWGTRVSLLARLDLVSYMLMPLWQTIVGASLIVAIVLAILDVAPFWGDLVWWQLLFFYLLGFGGVLMGCIARGAGQGLGGVLRNVLVAQVYAFYSWLLWPVLVRATARQLTDRRGWVKTEREQVSDAAGQPRPPAAHA